MAIGKKVASEREWRDMAGLSSLFSLLLFWPSRVAVLERQQRPRRE